MFIDGLVNADAIPVLEASAQFAARRHELIAHNVANLNTPNFRPVDVDPGHFRERLGEAIDTRRKRFGGLRGELDIRSSRQLRQTPSGAIELTPRESGRNVLFHDRNNRDLERIMQDLVENAAAFRVSTELLRGQMDTLRTAIRERV